MFEQCCSRPHQSLLFSELFIFMVTTVLLILACDHMLLMNGLRILRRVRKSTSSAFVSNSLRPRGLHGARQDSLSITNSQSPPKSMSIELVMPSNHLNLCCPLLLLPSVFPSIRVFSCESVLHIRWPKYWSFSFSISPCNEYSGLISFRMDWLDLLDP